MCMQPQASAHMRANHTGDIQLSKSTFTFRISMFVCFSWRLPYVLKNMSFLLWLYVMMFSAGHKDAAPVFCF